MAPDPDSDTADGTDAHTPVHTDADDSRSEPDRSVFSGGTLSDLFVNAVPVAMLVAFVVGFGVLAPGNLDSDPLLGFHAALIAGVVLVSAVAARAVVAGGGDLDGDREIDLYDPDERDDAGDGPGDRDGERDPADSDDDGGDGPVPDDPAGTGHSAGSGDADSTGDSRDDGLPRHNP
ncbi:DUF6684 family protein [Halobaculum halobium]|uniref:DUF6684 family protein n=1 Tax=Halobaculum halobium TaxID=3032281 RepID=A0ABD5TDW1_9EURY|nr:DUF6684 family protein [Halobaculum sp. SYNS20]